jgi:predicted DNA-binding mobile mystery protein A
MNYWDKKLMREQLDKRLSFLKSFASFEASRQGWVKTIREALGMSAKELGKRVGLDQSRVSRLENAEKAGDLKLSSLHKIAKGLKMRFVYGFVPENSLEEMVQAQARAIAVKRMKRLHDTMSLEKQELSGDEQQKALKDMIEKILVEQPKDFWSDK